MSVRLGREHDICLTFFRRAQERQADISQLRRINHRFIAAYDNQHTRCLESQDAP